MESEWGKLVIILVAFPPVDIVITMGCNVKCPFLPCKERYDWGLENPSGKSDDDFNLN